MKSVTKGDIMCLAIPSKVVSIKDDMGTVKVGGIERKVSFMLLPEVKIGDYVIVHAGFALQRLDPEEAKISLDLMYEYIEKADTLDEA